MVTKKRADASFRSPLAGLLFFAAFIGLSVMALMVLEPVPPEINGDPAGVVKSDHARQPRLVTLAPHLAELVYAAGAGEHLQAVTRHSDFPPPVRTLPVVGDAFALDYEKLLRLRPDVILAWDGGTPVPVVRKLRDLGFFVETIRIDTLADIGQAMRRIGVLVGATDAVTQADFFDLELKGRQKQAADWPSRRVFIQVSDKPLYTVSGKHWISQAVALCGLRNIFADLPMTSAPVTPESVVQRQPEFVVLLSAVSDPGPPGQAARLVPSEETIWEGWSQLPATRQQRLVWVSPDLLSRPGPRILQGVAALCEIVRGL